MNRGVSEGGRPLLDFIVNVANRAHTHSPVLPVGVATSDSSVAEPRRRPVLLKVPVHV